MTLMYWRLNILYIALNESPFVDALIEAARAGKEVTAVVEFESTF